MEQTQQPPVPQVPMTLPPAPNATAALVLGIISIPTCFCYGIVGLACGIIAIVLGGKALKAHKDNPGMYSESSRANANAGKICGIIGTCLSALFLVYVVVVMVIYGMALGAVFSGLSQY